MECFLLAESGAHILLYWYGITMCCFPYIQCIKIKRYREQIITRIICTEAVFDNNLDKTIPK